MFQLQYYLSKRRHADRDKPFLSEDKKMTYEEIYIHLIEPDWFQCKTISGIPKTKKNKKRSKEDNTVQVLTFLCVFFIFFLWGILQ